jgi:RNA polymerase sigma factor (sigma-70 family)
MGSKPRSDRSGGEATLLASSDRLTDEQLLRLFLDRGDQDAFETIVSRHGPRVLGVCRRILGQSPEVDDAFQSTFLLLARKAGSIRDRSALGHWLHGAAHRIAVRSKVRSRREWAPILPVVEPRAPRIEDDLDRRELRQVLHEEIDRLPERLRQPVLMCYLDGRTNLDAARLLDCPASTIKDRLGRAREILRDRLGRRGIALSAMLLILLLSGTARAETLPAGLASRTIGAAGRYFPRPRAGTPTGQTGRGIGPRMLLTLIAINLTTALVVMSQSATGLPRWIGWLFAVARRACH